MQRKSQVYFGIFAILVACSLIAALILPVILDAVSDDDNDSLVEPGTVDARIEESLRETAQAGSSDPLAYLALASYLANTGRLNEAIPWYERGIDLAPDDATIRVDFARSLAEGGLQQDAEAQFLKAIELDDSNPQAHFYLAQLYDRWTPQRTNEAIDHYERTIEVGPETFVAEQAAIRLRALTGGSATPEATPA